jgi:hypothetical protein
LPLSEDEQRILHQIEQQFYEHDPALAGELETTSLYTHTLSRMKWAVAAFIVGVAILVVALATATTFVVAFGGFVIMLASAMWFERNARKLGRAGWQRATASLRTGAFREQFGHTTERLRERFHRDEPD